MTVKRLIAASLMIGCLAVSGCGGGGSDTVSFNDSNYYWNNDWQYDDPEEDDYYYRPYVAIADFGKSKLIMLERNSIDEGSPWSFNVDLDTSPKTVAYSHYDRMMYVGCGTYINAVYAYENYFKTSVRTDDTVFLSSDFYSTIFGGWQRTGDFTYFAGDPSGNIYKYDNVWAGGSPVHTAVSAYGYYAAVSGTGSDGRTVMIYDRDGKEHYSCPDAGNRGLDIFQDGTVCAVCAGSDGVFRLNMISPSGSIEKSITLSQMANPWGVACVEYSDGSSEVFVTDCSESGQICVFDGISLTPSGTIKNTGMYTKHISRSPDDYTLYAVNQGDGKGNGASLTVINPYYDFDEMVTGIVNLGESGRILEGLSVMPYSESWR